MHTCSKLCNDCPCSSKSIKSWLADYTVADFVYFVNNEALFPCHKKVPFDMEYSQIEQLVIADGIPICRGYLGMLKLSCKLPRHPQLLELYNTVDVSPNSMSIFEFIKHHTLEV